MNGRVHRVLCWCSDKTGEKIDHIFLNTQSTFIIKMHIQGNAHQTFPIMCSSNPHSSEQLLSSFRFCLDLFGKLLHNVEKVDERLPQIMRRRANFIAVESTCY